MFGVCHSSAFDLLAIHVFRDLVTLRPGTAYSLGLLQLRSVLDGEQKQLVLPLQLKLSTNVFAMRLHAAGNRRRKILPVA
jgi:hypothetical protein